MTITPHERIFLVLSLILIGMGVMGWIGANG
jgi:hypothetical protein